MKTTSKQKKCELLKDIETAIATFGVLKDKLQLDTDSLNDYTIMRLISQKRQIISISSVVDEYMRKVRDNLKGES